MESFCMLKGLPIRVSDTLEGTCPLVLLHGYLETLEIWESFIPLLTDTFRVITLDLPGHGLSGFPTDATSSEPTSCTMEQAADVVAAYLDKVGVEKAVVAGHSMGGYVAQAFAKNYPTRTLGLALLNSTPFADTDAKRQDRDQEIKLIRSGKLEMLVEKSIPLLFAPYNRLPFSSSIESIIASAFVHTPEGIIACLEGMKQRSSYEDFLACLVGPDKKALPHADEEATPQMLDPFPVLFIFGTDDYHISLEKATALTASYPHATSYILEHAGHAAFIEEPTAVATALKQLDYHKKLPNG